MRRNYLEFIEQRKRNTAIYEAFNDKNFDKYLSKIEELMKKHIANLIPLVGYIETKSQDKEFISKQYIVINKKEYGDSPLFQINWVKSSNSLDPYSIDFFKDMSLLFTSKSKSSLTINTLGSSIIYFLPIIWTVINKGDYNLTEREAIDIGRSIFKDNKIKESYYYIGSLKYKVYESSYINEDDVYSYAKEKRKKLQDAIGKKDESPEAHDNYLKLAEEYNIIRDAIKGGATSINEIELAINRSVSVTINPSKSEKEQEEKFKEETEDPEIAFKKMEGYVKMVVKGVNPSLILCGAPGVGKTYRVRQILKNAGYIEEKNLFTIKGKCTARRLYLALYDYKDKGDILLIDDADSLVGPKAPEDCINILKGALDSTSEKEGRLITYGVAGKITDDDGNELPKRFYYNGSVIIITNYNAGSLDTALRGRSYIQDIHFSTESVLKLIKQIMPNLNAEKISMQSKIKAYDYLIELVKSGMDMEVSIRTFSICSTLFESMEGDDELAKIMIKEQMKLQSDRIKNKY